ncbi:MAG: hypothetical protein N838_07800 [Thiohalocapsa sp. PB-PSB1]|nr:MAG: hypothetical protein N838_07800 [Thiohalocapsa sp. PB-PSB1]
MGQTYGKQAEQQKKDTNSKKRTAKKEQKTEQKKDTHFPLRSLFAPLKYGCPVPLRSVPLR